MGRYRALGTTLGLVLACAGLTWAGAAGPARADVEVTLSGTIVDQYGAPAQRVGVMIEGSGASYVADTDAAGHYAVAVQPGSYRVSGFGSGYVGNATFAASTVTVGSDPTIPATDDATIDRSNWLELVAHDQFGAPVQVAPAIVQSGRPVAAGVYDDPAGAFDDLYDLPAGALTLEIGGPGAGLVAQQIAYTQTAGVTRLSIQVRRRVAITGRVVDEAGTPLPHIEYDVSRHTDAAGRFTVYSDVPLELPFVDKTGAHAMVTRQITSIPATGVALGDIVMPTAAFLHVTATDVHGHAIAAGVEVLLDRLTPGGWQSLEFNPPGSDGSSSSSPTVRGLPAGHYRARVRQHIVTHDVGVYDYQVAWARLGKATQFDLTAGHTAEVTARLKRAVHTATRIVAVKRIGHSSRRRITIQVSAGGRPVPTGQVRVEATAGTHGLGRIATLTRRKHGRVSVTLPRLPHGRVTLVVDFLGTDVYRFSETRRRL